nr:hypothetical protein CFP56_71480 [Quercus suber]
MRAFVSLFKGGLIAPTGLSYDSINALLIAEDEEERDRLTEQWRDHKLQELNFVGIVGALLTGCLTSTGSWPTILHNGRETPWPVRLCWYTGIVFGLFSVLTAAQQSIRLHRLSAHRDALANIRHFMGSKSQGPDGRVIVRPRRLQIYGWQTGLMFLTLSVAAMVVGMCILIWSSTEFGPLKTHGEGWWDANAKETPVRPDNRNQIVDVSDSNASNDACAWKTGSFEMATDFQNKRFHVMLSSNEKSEVYSKTVSGKEDRDD